MGDKSFVMMEMTLYYILQQYIWPQAFTGSPVV